VVAVAEPSPRPSSLAPHPSGLAGRIAGAAALIMLGNVLSRVLALGRVMLSSYYFGVTVEMKAFTIADNVRTMLFDLLISGMISAALVPVFSDYVDAERRPELRRIVATVLAIALVGVGAVVGLLMANASAVVHVMTTMFAPPGATVPDPAETALTTELVRAILPSVLLLSLSAVLLAALQALGRFAVFSLALLIPNVALIATVLLLQGGFDLGIITMVWGTVLGAALLVAAGLIGLRDLRPFGRVEPGHPAVRHIGRLYVPIFLGLLVSTAALILDRNFAASLDDRVIPAMLYATQVQQMALGLVAAAIALATLPALAYAAGAADLDGFRATLDAGLRLIVVLIVPATLGLLALAGPLTQLLFGHGATDAAGVALIALALVCYLPGLPFAAIDQLLIFAYYARKNTRTPVIVGVAAVLVYLGVALALLQPLGMVGLVLANSAQFISHALIMLWLARRSLGGLGGGLRRSLLRSTAAALPMAALAAGLAWLLGPLPGLAGEAARVALPAAAGAALYLWLLQRLGVDDLAHIGRLAARKLRGGGKAGGGDVGDAAGGVGAGG
jgi:putative peptidoglycan lipid II flippase